MADRIETIVTAPGAAETTQKIHHLAGAHRALHGAVHNLTHEFPMLGRAMNLVLRQVQLSTGGLLTMVGVMTAGGIAISKVTEKIKELDAELKRLNEEGIKRNIESQVRISEGLRKLNEQYQEFTEKLQDAFRAANGIDQALAREEKSIDAVAEAIRNQAKAQEELELAKVGAQGGDPVTALKDKMAIEQRFAEFEIQLAKDVADAKIKEQQRALAARNSLEASLGIIQGEVRGKLAASVVRGGESERTLRENLQAAIADLTKTQTAAQLPWWVQAAQLTGARALVAPQVFEATTARREIPVKQAAVNTAQKELDEFLRRFAGEKDFFTRQLGRVESEMVGLAGATARAYGEIQGTVKINSFENFAAAQTQGTKNQAALIALGKDILDIQVKQAQEILALQRKLTR